MLIKLHRMNGGEEAVNFANVRHFTNMRKDGEDCTIIHFESGNHSNGDQLLVTESVDQILAKLGDSPLRSKFVGKTLPFERGSFEVRRAHISGDGKDKRIVGYAATFNNLSNPIPTKDGSEFRERILPGAFDDVLASKPDVVMTLNHDANQVLGRSTSGTLTLLADERGLAFDCLLPNTSYANDAYESIQRGDINGCSFAFADAESEWDTEVNPRGLKGRGLDSFVVRTIRRFKQLFDVSVCTTPAYNGTQIFARSLAPELRSRFFASPTQWRQHPCWRSLCDTLEVDPDFESFDVVMWMNEVHLAQAPIVAKRHHRTMLEILDLQ